MLQRNTTVLDFRLPTPAHSRTEHRAQRIHDSSTEREFYCCTATVGVGGLLPLLELEVQREGVAENSNWETQKF